MKIQLFVVIRTHTNPSTSTPKILASFQDLNSAENFISNDRKDTLESILRKLIVETQGNVRLLEKYETMHRILNTLTNDQINILYTDIKYRYEWAIEPLELSLFSEYEKAVENL
jgi:hypothetical protein